MILLIDHYDSFVHNLARYFELLDQDTEVIRCDKVTKGNIKTHNPKALVFSPGPKAPQDIPNSIDLIKTFAKDIPILGVCLGHQCIVEAFEGTTERSGAPSHGESAQITHNGENLFHGLPAPLKVGRYHSLTSNTGEHENLTVTARLESGEVMAVAHTSLPVYGVQFHPESILTECGLDLLRNFVDLAEQHHKTKEAAS